MTQTTAFDYIRHGQTPFFRLPMADFSAGGPDSYQSAHAVVLGVPFDGGTTYQPGTRFAPYHVRRVSALVNSYHPVLRCDVFGKLKVLDGGNVAAPPFNAAAVRELVQAEVAMILAAGADPFLVGGDHSITLPALRALAVKHGPLAVVQIDAHFDTSGPEVWGEAHHHGTPFRHALKENLIDKAQLHQVGMRVTWKDASEREFSDSYGARVYPMQDIETRGVEAIAARILRDAGNRPLYLSVDVDAVDPAFAPGTGTPVPGGLSSREALKLLRELAGAHVVGMDVVEVAPPLDHADVTSHLAAHLVFEGLALRACRRSS
jgi:agmatinase